MTGVSTSRDIPRDPAVVGAAPWLIHQDSPPQPIVVELQERFGLAHTHAYEVHELAGRMQMLRRVFG